jgi:hypothetical protein
MHATARLLYQQATRRLLNRRANVCSFANVDKMVLKRNVLKKITKKLRKSPDVIFFLANSFIYVNNSFLKIIKDFQKYDLKILFFCIYIS